MRYPPAGLTAGIYLSRARMDTLLIEKAMPGGQAILTEIIENYPGFPHGITGPELMQKMEEQAVRFGLKIEYGETEEVKIKEDKVKIVKINSKEYRTLTIILASGAEASKLEVPGEEELRGRGVSYCATCDAPFFKHQKIVVVGGGDTAIEEALYLTKFVWEVTIIHRRDRLRATKILQERVFANKKINFAWDSVVTKILGKEKVEGVLIQNKKTGKEKEIIKVKEITQIIPKEIIERKTILTKIDEESLKEIKEEITLLLNWKEYADKKLKEQPRFYFVPSSPSPVRRNSNAAAFLSLIFWISSFKG